MSPLAGRYTFMFCVYVDSWLPLFTVTTTSALAAPCRLTFLRSTLRVSSVAIPVTVVLLRLVIVHA